MDTISFTVWNLEIPRPSRAGTNDDSIIFSTQFVNIDVPADVRIGDERLDKTHLKRQQDEVDEVRYLPRPQQP